MLFLVANMKNVKNNTLWQTLKSVDLKNIALDSTQPCLPSKIKKKGFKEQMSLLLKKLLLICQLNCEISIDLFIVEKELHLLNQFTFVITTDYCALFFLSAWALEGCLLACIRNPVCFLCGRRWVNWLAVRRHAGWRCKTLAGLAVQLFINTARKKRIVYVSVR